MGNSAPERGVALVRDHRFVLHPHRRHLDLCVAFAHARIHAYPLPGVFLQEIWIDHFVSLVAFVFHQRQSIGAHRARQADWLLRHFLDDGGFGLCLLA
jgi:hypothetical protein